MIEIYEGFASNHPSLLGLWAIADRGAHQWEIEK